MVIALVDLLEAEGRSLRRAVVRVGIGLALILVAVAFAVLGVLFCLWASYHYLISVVGDSYAGLLVGACSIVIAGGCIWIAKKLTH